MNTVRLKIPNSKGLLLNARLELPENEDTAQFVLFAHCFTCTSNLNAVRNISRSLTEQGFGVLRFDFTGLGNSEGEFADSHFSANVADLIAVSNFLEEQYQAPGILIGHSLGGLASLVAASKLPLVKAVATIGAPADVEHVSHFFSHRADEIKQEGSAEVNIGGRPFTLNREFIENFKELNVAEMVKGMNKALLIMHSPVDTIVGIENAQRLYQRALHPKSFISLDNADHLLSDAKDSQYVGNVIGAWASRYFLTKE